MNVILIVLVLFMNYNYAIVVHGFINQTIDDVK